MDLSSFDRNQLISLRQEIESALERLDALEQIPEEMRYLRDRFIHCGGDPSKLP